jgi:hypothetical protein
MIAKNTHDCPRRTGDVITPRNSEALSFFPIISSKITHFLNLATINSTHIYGRTVATPALTFKTVTHQYFFLHRKNGLLPGPLVRILQEKLC